MSTKKNSYNIIFQNDNYFGYKGRIYWPYIKSLISSLGLKKKSSILDAGCGQGFFSYLLDKCGMKVYGIDISESGIRAAKNNYSSSNVEFIVGDIQAIPFSKEFDCVFTRSCSLYNTDDFPLKNQVTDYLLSFVRDGGIFIFLYNTNLGLFKKSKSWRFHTLCDAKKHFSLYPNTRISYLV